MTTSVPKKEDRISIRIGLILLNGSNRAAVWGTASEMESRCFIKGYGYSVDLTCRSFTAKEV